MKRVNKNKNGKERPRRENNPTEQGSKLRKGEFLHLGPRVRIHSSPSIMLGRERSGEEKSEIERRKSSQKKGRYAGKKGELKAKSGDWVVPSRF